MMIRPAVRIFPARWSAEQERTRTLADVVRTPSAYEPPCDPPTIGRAHWEAVWRAVAASTHTGLERETSWTAEQQQLTQLAATLSPVPTPAAYGEHRLIALVPPPEGVGPEWVAVYLHAEHYKLTDADGPATRIERVTVPAETTPAIFHVAAQALVPVELLPFEELHPRFYVETVYEDREWHEVAGFDRLPTTPEAHILAELYSLGSKLGGFPVLNAQYDEPAASQSGEPMHYALHLAADFFDCTFGDAGSLHVWLSASGDARAEMDSA